LDIHRNDRKMSDVRTLYQTLIYIQYIASDQILNNFIILIY
jgi:hypothetical protein